MALLTLTDVSIRYQGPPLLDGISCQIEAGERIGLLGRNGAGKTTLMRLIAGQEQPDHGSVILAPGKRVAILQQDVPAGTGAAIRELVAAGWEADESTSGSSAPSHDWERDHAVDRILSRMELDPDRQFSLLSSGMKRRVLLARALVVDPDLLLLDEPTNHLDLEAIEWLEGFLQRFAKSLIFVTHDRMFLRHLANRILEVERGRLFDWACDYDTFLQRKEQALEAEEKQEALFDKRLAEEERWIRQGIKARRTRNEGRVRALQAMREERRQRQARTGTSQLAIQEASRSGDLVLEATDIGFHYPEGTPLIENFSTTLLRGDKVGILGRNGSGKSTLLKLLLGKLTPTSGKIRTGTRLEIGYFDQLRDQLNGEQTVAENVGDGYDYVTLPGGRKHLLGFLQEFLFTPERARTPVKFLSGGERNRVLLAKLFTKPVNLLVLDEPTNDLDMETLEVLETRLVEYQGTLLVVSHDREFLNRVVTSTIVFEPGGIREYVGGYDDWLRQRSETAGPQAASTATPPRPSVSPSPPAGQKPAKLSYREQQELARLPDQIDALETEQAALHERFADPTFYQQPGELIAASQSRLKDLETELARNYARWEELELRNG